MLYKARYWPRPYPTAGAGGKARPYRELIVSEQMVGNTELMNQNGLTK